MPAKLMEYFNKMPRLGSLSTSNKDGRVNVAVFGSPRMTDEKRVIMATRKNRTFVNLQENPYAVFMIMEPGKTSSEWRGLRVYLKMTGFKTEGDELAAFRKEIAKRVSEEAAKAIYAAVAFEVYDMRPLVDTGQKWEDSI
ncbi:MAG TPA: pyridoxamine 5'-phosphate oxidase family protein [Thermodesulfobacteriota bacterium]|nr:pyridoxamine 5'-phosphate oxidase family protein [Thermodesulfobacteriota bacterium]